MSQSVGNRTALRAHPDVLEVRWQVYAKAGKWEPCVDIGNALVKTAPERPFGWVHRSFALHELKRTKEASDLLVPAAGSGQNYGRRRVPAIDEHLGLIILLAKDEVFAVGALIGINAHWLIHVPHRGLAAYGRSGNDRPGG